MSGHTIGGLAALQTPCLPFGFATWGPRPQSLWIWAWKDSIRILWSYYLGSVYSFRDWNPRTWKFFGIESPRTWTCILFTGLKIKGPGSVDYFRNCTPKDLEVCTISGTENPRTWKCNYTIFEIGNPTTWKGMLLAIGKAAKFGISKRWGVARCASKLSFQTMQRKNIVNRRRGVTHGILVGKAVLSRSTCAIFTGAQWSNDLSFGRGPTRVKVLKNKATGESRGKAILDMYSHLHVSWWCVSSLIFKSDNGSCTFVVDSSFPCLSTQEWPT